MFKNLSNLKLLFFFMLIMSTLLSISSSSWLTIWMMMEINSMAFIPMMMNVHHMKSSESMMLYFLIQSISSMNFITIIILNNMINNWSLIQFNLKLYILNIILLMKMGAAPFYFWFPKVMKELNWNNNFLLMTWQKIIPMLLIYYCMCKMLIYASIFLSTLISSLMALNQMNMKLIMSFSSINHMGWLMMTLVININIWIIYIMNYFILNFILCKMFFLMNIKSLINIFTTQYSKCLKMILLLNFFSMGGIPPFFGFFPKWLVLMSLFYNNMYLMLFVLISTTLTNLFFYLRIMSPSLILYHSQFKFMKPSFNLSTLPMMNMMTLTYLNIIFMPLIILIYQFT